MPQIDDYLYDPLNRIQQVSESQQSSAGQVSFLFTQKYAYDRWGNRTIDVPGTTPSIPGVTRKSFVVDAATNRLTSSDGCAMTYDAAGNQTYDCVGTHYYDAENRMTKAVQGSSNNYYFYDGNGKRVRRILNGSQTWGGQETWFVYGFDGELAAEYAYNQVTAPLAMAPQKEYGYRGGKLLVVWDGTQAGDDQLKWLVTDHLGSTRMEANRSGSLATIRRHDYLPFGEELVASTGTQRGGVGYEPPQSSVRQRFDGYERDNETGLDFAQARYYNSMAGRFTSVDPLLSSAKVFTPQSWNRYAFCWNNPLRFIDPDGEELKVLDDKALEYVRKTLPENIRSKIKLDKNGMIDKDALNKIKSKDQNFLDLKAIVNDSSTIEIGTATNSPNAGEFSYQSAKAAQKEAYDSLIKAGMSPKEAREAAASVNIPSLYLGETLSPDLSPSGNMRVIISDGTGNAATAPLEQRVVTTGHELYGHAGLYIQGKDWQHGNLGGPVDTYIKQAENQTRRNFRGQQPNRTVVPPKKD